MSHDSVDDLVALARRGSLTEPELRRLEILLKTSDGARVLHEVGVDFDSMQTAASGDDRLFEQIAERVEQRFGSAAAPRPRKRLVRWAAAIALVSGGAAAAALLDVGGAPAPTEQGSPAPSIVAPGASTHVPRAAGREEAKPATEVDLERAAPARADPPPEPGARPGRAQAPSKGSPPAVDRPEPTARDLFSEANRARKEQRVDQALTLYLKLQRSFPGSAEAKLSHLQAARLLMARQRAGQALAQFDGYLTGGGGGGLAAEALWGKAQALAQLGRPQAERSVLEELVKRFPNSVYAPTARQRLER